MSIEVVTDATVEPISLELAWAHLHLDAEGSPASTPHDLWLESVGIPAARSAAEKFTQRSYAQKTLRLWLDEFPDGAIELQFPPVVAVSSVQYVDQNGDTQTMSTSDYSLDNKTIPGWVLPAHGTSWPATLATANAVSVTYTVGASSVDPLVRAAMLLMLGHLFKNREQVITGTIVTEMKAGFDALLWPDRVGLGVR